MSKSFSEIDKNFAVQTQIERENIAFFAVPTDKIKLYGVFREGEKFRRMPETVAKTVSEGVYALHAVTAGGRVRFRTDSPYIALYAKIPFICKVPVSSLCGMAGFDIYTDGEYYKTYVPDYFMTDEVRGVVDLDGGKMREITINMPVYSEVSELYIGLDKDAALDAPTPYTMQKPIVYYGSSITQGGCASRPGLIYQNVVSRHFDADYINLGFAGNAMGEDEIADYIKNLDMSIFVYDYDFNAPDLAHLEATHERMFLKIREANPTLPIVILPKPKYKLTPSDAKRRDTIKQTYENAIARGDENVYFIPGSELMALVKMDGTVDGTHPNDFGFYSMAQKLIELIEKNIWKVD